VCSLKGWEVFPVLGLWAQRGRAGNPSHVLVEKWALMGFSFHSQGIEWVFPVSKPFGFRWEEFVCVWGSGNTDLNSDVSLGVFL